MAKFKSLFKVKGSLDDVSFYKTRNGHQARLKGGVESDRIATDPAFKRTRENAAEFAAVAASKKLLRLALRSVIKGIRDGGMNNRLSRVLHQVKRLDLTSDRGQRTVAIGLESEDGREALSGFSFNDQAPLDVVLAVVPVVDLATGVVTLPKLNPAEDLFIPAGATHFLVGMAWAKVDFHTGKFDTVVTELPLAPLDQPEQDIVLTPSSTPAGEGRDLFALKVVFYQYMNGKMYDLTVGTATSSAIIGVA
ncbi:MAG: hypothetical protein K9I85_15520 [Saprospiraceae bacterium]|nr:hypothetical protein [Saprospiraceae bacterium]